MKRSITIIVFLFLGLAGCLHTGFHQLNKANIEKPGSLCSDIRQFDQATIEKLGVAIYEQDIRAARATDILFAKVNDPVKQGLRGWIVEGDAKAMLVRFIREKDGLFDAYYDVKFEGTNAPVLLEPENRKLSDAQLAQHKARSLALKNIKKRASKNYNPVVLPDPEGDGFLVYALAATTNADEVMIGGHYRFTISKDGERVERSDELFRSLLVLKIKGDVPQGSALSGFYAMSLVSNMPLETHVYLSLLHRLPFSVGTPDGRIWWVENGKIEILKPGEGQ